MVGVPGPPVALTPVRAGIEKYVASQAAGAEVVMLASLVSVTVSGLLAFPLPPTTKGVVKVWELPLVAVEYAQMTSLGVDARQPACVVVSPLVVYPVAYVVLVGRFTAVIVTGKELGLVMVSTTSPLPPGYNWSVAEGLATAAIVRLETLADCASPEEPAATPTTQLVTP